MIWWKWIIVTLVAALGLVGVGWWLARAQGQHQAQIAAQQTATADHQRDSVVAVIHAEQLAHEAQATADSVRAAQLEQRQQIDAAARLAAEAKADSALTALAAATSAADSLPIYRDQVVPALLANRAALRNQLARSDSGRTAWRDAYQQQLAATAVLQQRAAADSTLITSQRATIMALQSVPVVARSFWPRLGAAAETGAIGLVTLEACRAHVLSLGCLAGVAVTGRRLLR